MIRRVHVDIGHLLSRARVARDEDLVVAHDERTGHASIATWRLYGPRRDLEVHAVVSAHTWIDLPGLRALDGVLVSRRGSVPVGGGEIVVAPRPSGGAYMIVAGRMLRLTTGALRTTRGGVELARMALYDLELFGGAG